MGSAFYRITMTWWDGTVMTLKADDLSEITESINEGMASNDEVFTAIQIVTCER
jgi:hypothetical protein